jgi:ubiquinone biosynthesis protein Coq4
MAALVGELLKNPGKTELIYALAHALQMRWPRLSARYFIKLETLARHHQTDLERMLSLNQHEFSIAELATCPAGSVGAHVLNFYQQTGYLPTLARLPLNGASPQMARLVTSSRNIHDILHVLTELNTSVEDEICLQAFIAANTRSAFSVLLVLLGLAHILWFKPMALFKTFVRAVQFAKCGLRAAFILACDFSKILAMELNSARHMLRI